MKKRILVTTTTFPSFLKNDSTPSFVYELSKRLAKKNDLDIVISTPYIKNSKEFEERDNLKIYRYKYGFTALRDGAILPNIKKNKFLIFQIPFFLLFSFFNIIKLVGEEEIDIIHTHWIIPQGFLAVLYKKIFKKRNLRIICTVHGGDIFSLRGWLMTKIKKWTLNNVDEITVVSKEIKNEARKIGVKNKNIRVMPMGADENVFNPDRYNENIKKKYNITGPFLLFVGRLVEKKGVKYAISAMPAVLKKHSNVKFIIIGDGPLEGNLKKQVTELGLESNIIFTEGIPNSKLPEYYATADIFLGPSVTAKNGDSEGFGLVFVEALLCKCCVIVSGLKSISDIIRNEETGIQVDVKNIELFANKIIKLINDEDDRKRLVESGYEFAKKNFIWSISVEKYYNLIRNL
ncbi:glycosyltransferase [Patescibacteria group bacterium]|nr:glycosyltransferase [Patescibacteria group bacterium]